MTRDDVVMQRPEDVRFLVPVFHTSNACCGAATAYLLRRIAYRAGAYAPGIQEQHVPRAQHVARRRHASRRSSAGSTAACRRSTSSAIACSAAASRRRRRAILDWVKQGKGYRGAMLPTDFKKLHPQPGAAGEDAGDDMVAHAVGVTIDRLEAKGDEDLVMIDPWPGVGGAKDRGKLSPAPRERAPRQELPRARRTSGSAGRSD